MGGTCLGHWYSAGAQDPSRRGVALEAGGVQAERVLEAPAAKWAVA